MINDLNALMDVSDRNLGKRSELLASLAEGDLTARLDGQYHGVFAHMRDDANTTVTQLAGIVGRIQQAASAITGSASEIAAGNNDLSQRTGQQAANLEETAASMEERTSTVKQHAESARQANQLAIGAASVASQRGPRGEPGRGHHVRYPDLVQEDRRNHQRHRWHRLPEQYFWR